MRIRRRRSAAALCLLALSFPAFASAPVKTCEVTQTTKAPRADVKVREGAHRGLTWLAKDAVEAAGKNVPIGELVVTLRGEIREPVS